MDRQAYHMLAEPSSSQIPRSSAIWDFASKALYFCKPLIDAPPPPPLRHCKLQLRRARGPIPGAVVRAVTYRSRQMVMRGCANFSISQPLVASAMPAELYQRTKPRRGRISFANLENVMELPQSQLAGPPAALGSHMHPPSCILLSSFDCNIA
ncbi:hypothetical protein CFAM422_011685 [Trichoderma lentiforme]|uniref:Uncharacterized protein n=1 Tax=Trichoderma lentiforme TaxID=1567552 RepID=A0A9P4X3Z0_9HYPO|nr:hypothetical protein CFAM422_011685 [Trichoderma lentiforme]